MSTSVGRVVLTFDVDDKGVVQGLGRVKGEVDKSTSTISTKAIAMGAAIGTAAGKIAVDALQYLGREFMAIATRGVELAPVVTSFENLTASIGLSGEAMLSVTREASKGLITDLDLMAAANKAILLGLPVTSESMGTMAKAAVALGKAMRQDATKSFDDLITALGRSSPMILDNLGLSVKVGEANEAYARSLGKSADALTDNEKKLAFYNAAMEAARRKVDEVGGIQLTLADRIQIAKNQFANFTDSLGVAVATSPVINAAFDSIGQAITAAVGDNQTVRVQQLSGTINTLAIKAATVAQVMVSGAGIIVRAWEGLKLVFAGVMTGFMALNEGVIKSFSSIVEAANKMPGVRGEFDLLAATLRDDAAMAEGMRQSFQDQTAEAWEGVKGNSALGQTLAALGARIDETKAAMITASRTQADSAEIARQLITTQQAQVQSADQVAAAAAKVTKAADEERGALRSLGLVLARDVTAQMELFERALNRAEREGVPLTVAISAMIPKLVELIAKAKASGLSVEGLEKELALARQTVRDLNGGIPQFTIAVRNTLPPLSTMAGGVRTVTSESLKAATQAHLTSQAFEFFGQKTQADLTLLASTARQRYADMLASGQATAEGLKLAWQGVVEAEIAAGERSVITWSAVMGEITKAFSNGLDGLKQYAWDFGMNFTAAVLDTLVPGLGQLVVAAWPVIEAGLKKIGKLIGDFFEWAWDGLTKLWDSWHDTPLPIGKHPRYGQVPAQTGSSGGAPPPAGSVGRGAPPFSRGGEVFAGPGMAAELHGHEAVFPLPAGFDLASSLQALDGRGGQASNDMVERLGRRFDRALVELRTLLPLQLRDALGAR